MIERVPQDLSEATPLIGPDALPAAHPQIPQPPRSESFPTTTWLNLDKKKSRRGHERIVDVFCQEPHNSANGEI